MHAVRASGCLLLLSALLPGAFAQSPAEFAVLRDLPPNIVLPQRRVIPLWPGPRPLPAPERVQITGVEADIAIRGGVATTTLTVRLFNPGHSRAEAIVLLPVPDQAAVRTFTFEGPGAESTAKLLPRDEARRIYDAIVARCKDPALLEFAGLNVVRSSVFPVDPRGRQAVQLTYEQVLPADGPRRDYALPRSDALDCDVPWKITLRLEDSRTLGAIYSPSHALELERSDPRHATLTLAPDARRTPGSFLLSYVVNRDGTPAATTFLYPDPAHGGGYFLLLAGAPPAATPANTRLRREVTLVLDRSGSMRGDKLAQAQEAARQVLAGLEPGERFHLIAYNEVVDACSDAPEVVSPASRERALGFIDALTARGGTNIHDALLEALRPAPAEGFVPVVLFLTDGMPTVGTTEEKAIRELVTRANPHHRRVFTFGVGTEVNAPLLQSLAVAARGAATFVLPGEDIEVKVASTFRRLSGPVFAGPVVGVEENGQRSAGRTLEVLPHPLPDLFAGDELLVFGRYRGATPFDLVLTTSEGKPASLRALVDPAQATVRHSFVPRLWASRRIGVLVTALRDLGAEGRDPRELMREPATRELVEEIVRLSTEFGILTEYTSFLAEEGSELPAPAAAAALASDKARREALPQRSGSASLSMEVNNAHRLQQRALNPVNRVYDETLVAREVTTIQQTADVAFYQRGSTWLDSRLAVKGASHPAADRVIEPGTPEHRALIDQLVREGRQAAAALSGDVYLEVSGRTVLLRNGTP